MSDNTGDSTRHVLDAIDGALAWEPWNDPMRFSWETEAMSWSPTELATADERREQAAPADDSGGYDPDDQGSTVYMARDVLEALLAEGDAVPLRETVTRLREAGGRRGTGTAPATCTPSRNR